MQHVARYAVTVFVIMCAVVGGTVMQAQDATPEPEETVPAFIEVDPAEVGNGTGLPDFGAFVPDYAVWNGVAAQAEDTVLRDVASKFRLNRERADVIVWRDLFQSLIDQDASRLATLDSQIVALGPPPEEGGDEPAAIAARRAALSEQRATVAAPALLVQEAHARADGLIREIDQMIRARKTAALLEQGPSPLNPAHWGVAVQQVWQGFADLGRETGSAVRGDLATGAALQKLPIAALYIGLAFLLMWRGRQWLAQRQFARDETEQNVLQAFGLGLGQIAVPLIGVIALTLAVVTLDPAGLRSSAVISVLPLTALVIVVGYWLAGQFFPPAPQFGPLGYDPAVRDRLRRMALLMAWGVGLWLPLLALIDSGNAAPEVSAVANLPVIVVLGFALFRFGQLLRSAPSQNLPEGRKQQGRIRKITGRFCQAVALAAPILAALGYAALAEGILLPTIVSLAVLAVVIYFQRMVNDVYAYWARARGRQSETLVPVLVGFVMLMLALPLLALIWGFSTSELAEVWTRFREGFVIGDSRLSPTDFITFATVFAVGYVLTRLIQGTLRVTVLPRTRLDLGGQNAIVAGFGYVGIGAAAIIAITSAGLDLSNLAIVAGALSVGIGFGLQNIVSNFVSGIILLIERPVSEGDWIEVGGQMGYVRDISVRSTRIETFDRTDVIVPNADLVSNQVTNWTRGNLVGRVIVPVGVAYGSDVEKVQTILREIAEAHPMVLMSPPPAVLFMGFGASSLDFEIRAILRDVNFVLATKSEMNVAIASRFAQEGIEIPFPQTDLWLRNPETLKPDTAKGDT